MDELEAVRTFYDGVFPHYRELKAKTHFQTDCIEKLNMLRLVGDDLTGRDLLDVGFGLGGHLAEYAARGALTCGIDLCARHIEHAVKVLPDCELIAGDFLAHDFGERRFDVITASLVVSHMNLAQKRQFFEKVNALLQPGGSLFFSDKNPVVEGLDFTVEPADGCLDVWKIAAGDGYFRDDKLKRKPHFGLEMLKYHMSMERCIALLLGAGFAITGYSDCFPDTASRDRFPEEFAYFSRVPQFFVMRATRRY